MTAKKWYLPKLIAKISKPKVGKTVGLNVMAVISLSTTPGYCYMLLVRHDLQVVPRGSRDGEPMNMRRATVAHETGNKCPNR